jgi:hypothetical protein
MPDTTLALQYKPAPPLALSFGLALLDAARFKAPSHTTGAIVFPKSAISSPLNLRQFLCLHQTGFLQLQDLL